MIDIWLIEDNQTFRRSVARAFDQLGGLTCSRQFSRCEDALQVLASAARAPHVILLDLGLPGMGGLAGLPLLAHAAPGTPVLVLTVFDDHDRLFRALCAGAAGYLPKTSSLEEIGEAIREVMRGGAALNPRIARRVLDLFGRFPPPSRDYGLTVREREILNLVVAGLIKKEIAERLAVSYHTVDAHLRKVYQKLEVTTRQAAVAKALREGIV